MLIHAERPVNQLGLTGFIPLENGGSLVDEAPCRATASLSFLELTGSTADGLYAFLCFSMALR
jgi:hypothetical protein